MDSIPSNVYDRWHTFLVLCERHAACIKVAACERSAARSSSVRSFLRRFCAIPSAVSLHAEIAALRTCWENVVPVVRCHPSHFTSIPDGRK